MKELWNTIIEAGKSSLFVLLFLALIQPFGIDTVKDGRIAFILSETFLTFVSVVVSTVAANAVMRDAIGNEKPVKAALHLLLFFVINTPLLGAMLLTYVSWFNEGDPLCYWFYDHRFNCHGWATMSMYVSSISVIVAVIIVYQLRNCNLRRRVAEMERLNQMLESREDSDEATADEAEPLDVEFIGQGQKSRLKVSPSDIIYVESMANYADICHIAGNEIRHSTLRITLKQVRQTLADADCIIQCHRAFLVNVNFIQKISSRNSGFQLQLFGIEKLIPVSRANEDAVKQRLI